MLDPLAPAGKGREIGVLAALAAAYVVGAKLGLAFATVHPSATPVWPPTGIAIASLLLIGYRAWPSIFLGAFVANLTTYGAAWTSAGIATGNTLEGLIGAYLVNRYAAGPAAFDRPQDTVAFAALATLAATIGASVGVTSLALGGLARWSAYGPIWLTWWLGDATGALSVAPPIVLWMARSGPPWGRRHVLERALFLVALLPVAGLVFGGVLGSVYPIWPFLAWAAVRFGGSMPCWSTSVPWCA